jgi:hypothetical protein
MGAVADGKATESPKWAPAWATFSEVAFIGAGSLKSTGLSPGAGALDSLRKSLSVVSAGTPEDFVIE